MDSLSIYYSLYNICYFFSTKKKVHVARWCDKNIIRNIYLLLMQLKRVAIKLTKKQLVDHQDSVRHSFRDYEKWFP